jgi:hypothetical protein
LAIDLVELGGGDDEIGAGDVGFLEGLGVGAVADEGGDVEAVADGADAVGVLVDDGDAVSGRGEDLGSERADMSSPADHDAHERLQSGTGMIADATLRGWEPRKGSEGRR